MPLDILNNNTTRLSVRGIRTDGGTQPRAGLTSQIIIEYAEAITGPNDWPFPPLVVYFDGSDYWLADGFHRLAAAKMYADREKIAYSVVADVRQGTQRDAILYSVGANSDHGLRRTSEDKRRAVMRLLEDSEWSQWSNREIARRCNVDEKTVRTLRDTLSAENPQIERKVERNGTVYTQNTAKIGATKPATASVDDLTRHIGSWLSQQIGTPMESLTNAASRGSVTRRHLELFLGRRDVTFHRDDLEAAIAQVASNVVKTGAANTKLTGPMPTMTHKDVEDLKARQAAPPTTAKPAEMWEIQHLIYQLLAKLTPDPFAQLKYLESSYHTDAVKSLKPNLEMTNNQIRQAWNNVTDQLRQRVTNGYTPPAPTDNTSLSVEPQTPMSKSISLNLVGNAERLAAVRKVMASQPDAAATILDDLKEGRRGWYHDAILCYCDDTTPEEWKRIAAQAATPSPQLTEKKVDELLKQYERTDGWKISISLNTWQAFHYRDQVATPVFNSAADLLDALDDGNFAEEFYFIDEDEDEDTPEPTPIRKETETARWAWGISRQLSDIHTKLLDASRDSLDHAPLDGPLLANINKAINHVLDAKTSLAKAISTGRIS